MDKNIKYKILTCRSCKFFYEFTVYAYINSGIISMGFCNNENSDHYNHMLYCEHTKCIHYKKEIKI